MESIFEKTGKERVTAKYLIGKSRRKQERLQVLTDFQ